MKRGRLYCKVIACALHDLSEPFFRLLAVGGIGLTGAALLGGCGSGGGEGTATLPPGVSAGAGAGTLPTDVAITRPG
jgi:hypothetical protein